MNHIILKGNIFLNLFEEEIYNLDTCFETFQRIKKINIITSFDIILLYIKLGPTKA